MNQFSDEELTRNAFLGGRLHMLQPKAGYRAGVDPVLLAAAVPAKPGHRVLELGCGAGAAALCLAARLTDLRLSGVELQDQYADLARRNAQALGVPFDVVVADLSDLPNPLRQQQFDHVIANPPYYLPGTHSSANDSGRSIALGEGTPLEAWIDVAARRLAPRGYLHMIQKADRLPDMLVACAGRLGSLEVLPLAARVGRKAELVILRARKEGRSPFRLHAPLILHRGERHLVDEEHYLPEIAAVLRDGAPLPWPES